MTTSQVKAEIRAGCKRHSTEAYRMEELYSKLYGIFAVQAAGDVCQMLHCTVYMYSSAVLCESVTDCEW